jgi:phosphomannomutase
MKIVKTAPNSVGLESGLDSIRDYVIKQMAHTSLDELAGTFAEALDDAGAKSEVTQFFENKLETIGSIKEIDLFLAQNDRKLKVVVDTANGMGGWLMPTISGMYENVEFIPLYWDLDGQFPNHPADPLKPENLKDLQELVQKEDADLGVAFDGDADRAFFVDENGHRIDGNFLVSVFAQTLVKDVQKEPQSPFNPAAVYSLTGSRCMPESINEVSGVAIPSKQGHTYFKKLMSDYRAVYGGEFTGHHYFADFGYMDSGFIALVLFLKTLVLSGQTVSEMFQTFHNRYFLSEEIVLQIPEGQTFDDLKLKVKEAFADATSIHEQDGIAVFYPQWKFNLRPSNTEPVLRFLLESRQDDFEFNVERKVADVRAVLGC